MNLYLPDMESDEIHASNRTYESRSHGIESVAFVGHNAAEHQSLIDSIGLGGFGKRREYYKMKKKSIIEDTD